MDELRESVSRFQVKIECGGRDIDSLKQRVQDSVKGLLNASFESIQVVGSAILVIFDSVGKDAISIYGKIKDALSGMLEVTLTPVRET